MLENTEIVRERTQQTLGAVHTHTHTHTHTHIYSYRRIAGQPGERVTFKPNKNGLLVILKIYNKYKNIKDELCKKIHNSSSFFFT